MGDKMPIPRLIKCDEGQAYTRMGKNQFRDWALKIGAARRFGRSVRYDLDVINRELDRMAEEAEAKRDN